MKTVKASNFDSLMSGMWTSPRLYDSTLIKSQPMIPQLSVDLLLLTFVFPYEGFFVPSGPAIGFEQTK